MSGPSERSMGDLHAARAVPSAAGGGDDGGDDDRLPNRLPRPEGELERLERAWRAPDGWRRLSAVNNTWIGLYYIAASLVFFVLAGLLGLLIRAQLTWPDSQLLSPAFYNQVFTMHGTVMMFLFAVPVVEAIAIYLLPAMLGARDLPFPRLGAYAFWAYAVGGLAFFATIFAAASPDGGWFMYPPLTGKQHSPGIGADWWLLGIGFIEISAIAGAIELIVGILFTRAPGMSLMRMPIFAWAMLVVAFMIVFAFPAVIAGTTLLEMERAFDWPFFIAERGGDPILWQHLFWFFGHPEVYIIFLPAAGLVTMMIPTLARTPLVGYRAVVWALVAVGVISFALWAHHMFTAGLGSLQVLLVSAASLAIAIPTGVQVFAWLATLWRGRLQVTGATLFVLGFLFIFVLGGLTGVMVAILPFDWQVHDTYFIVAHFHYVLIGGVVFPVFAAIYHWMPVVNGRMLSERAARWIFGAMFVGFNVAFFPMHLAGLWGMPRRVYTYAAGFGLEVPNLLATGGAALFAAGVAAFLVDVWRTLRRPEAEHGDPWEAGTLEWLPSASYATRSIPQIGLGDRGGRGDDARAREPLWDRPTLAVEVEAGRHWLPGSATGLRETILTSPGAAALRHVIVLPGDGWLPVVAGVGTAGFFLLLTVGWIVAASAFGAAAVVAIWRWLWAADRGAPDGATEVRVGERVVLPLGARGARSHSWWAVVVLIAVDATIFLSFVFAHLHVSMRATVCPPPGSRLPAGSSAWIGVGLWLASALAMWAVGRGDLGRVKTTGGRAWASARIVAALALAAAAAWIALDGHRDVGFDPRANAWSATVGAMGFWQGFHLAVLAAMAAFLIARAWSGALDARRRATLDNVRLFWAYAGAQGAIVGGFVQLLPRFMG